MEHETKKPPAGNALASSAVANSVADIAAFDPGLRSYKFNDLGEAVRFGEVMSHAGEMIPQHLRGKPALCMAVTMRAVSWGFDPFALATETYQAQSGGVIGYQAKVFTAALRVAAGIQLQYEYEGEYILTDRPATSARGNAVAPRAAKGDRRVTAWAKVDGVRLEYTSPRLDDIAVKNSPLWHNDPDQQLAYYAARAWARRHRPEVMMGAFSTDEVDQMADEKAMRDITPAPKAGGFAALASKAKGREEPAPTPEPERLAAIIELTPIELEGCVGSGRKAFAEGETIDACPIEPGAPGWQQWIDGWREAEMEADTDTDVSDLFDVDESDD